MSYWAFSDQFEEPGPPQDPFHGGFGLMNVDGLRKPAFFAYQLLAELYDAEIPVDAPRVIATQKGTSARVLLWDYSPTKPDAPNNPCYTRDISATELPEAVLSFTELPRGTYRVSRTGIVWHRNDVYDAYLALGKPTGPGGHLSNKMLAKLRAPCTGDSESLPNVVVNSTGKAEIRIPMRTNDIWLLSLEKTAKK